MRAQQSVNDTIAWLRAADDPNAIAGGAFLVTPRLALTCAHVVRDHLGLGKPTPRQLPTGTICLTFQGLRVEAKARVAPSGWWPGGGDDDVEDVAVLELATPLADIKLPALAVFPASGALECEIYGTTGGYETIGQTVYAQLAAKPSWQGWHQIDARAGRESSYFVRQGFSGAPVLDALGNTIWGMVAIVETAPEKLVAYAIAPAHLRIATDAVLQAARVRQDPVEPPKKPGPLDQLAREALTTLLGEDIDLDAPSPERVEELRSALRDLAERGRKPAATGPIAEALQRLREGKTSDAEAVFAAIVQQKRGEGKAAYREAAEAARHLGAIAYVNDTAKAIEAYRTATELDSDGTWSWIFLGRLYQQAGDLAAAEQAFEQARAVAERAGDDRDVGVSYHDLGTVQQARGNLEKALQAYTRYHEVAERLAAQDPGNAGWQRDLSVSFNKIGDVQGAQGNLDGALQAYQDGLDIAAKLAAQDPGNAGWRYDLGISNERIGDVLMAQGKLAGALSAYERKHQAISGLVEQDPSNALWQRDLTVSFDRIGNVQRAQGNLDGALQAYQDGLAIREKLAAQDPGNAEWQRNLSVSFTKIGDVQGARGNLDGALQAYQDSHAIFEKLAAQDRGNAGWQMDLAVSHERFGDVAAGKEDRAEAIAAFEEALAIYEDLLARYPENIQFLTFSVVPRWRLGVLQGPGGRAHLERALQILKTLDAEDRLDANRKGWIAQIEEQLAR